MATTQAEAEQTERRLRPLYGNSTERPRKQCQLPPVATTVSVFREGTHKNGPTLAWWSFYAFFVLTLHKKKPHALFFELWYMYTWFYDITICQLFCSYVYKKNLLLYCANFRCRRQWPQQESSPNC